MDDQLTKPAKAARYQVVCRCARVINTVYCQPSGKLPAEIRSADEKMHQATHKLGKCKDILGQLCCLVQAARRAR